MNRSIVYDEEQIDPFDVLWQNKDVLAALGGLMTSLAGQNTTVVSGFAPTQTSPASLSINLGAGLIFQQSPIDPTQYGALPLDTSVVQQQGYAGAQSITLSTTGLSSGQSMWALVQAQFSQVDVVRPGDPTGGVLNYINPDNPTEVFQGPNGDGQSQPTLRQATVAIQIIYGTPASTGSEVPPNPTNGWVPLYLIDLAFNQTTITTGQILVAGPSVGANVPSNYTQAPFLAGLLNQHHKGIAGQAPQIDLTAEVKNLLPLANSTASNTSGGGLPVMKLHAGNPNGNVAGNASVNGASDFCYDVTNLVLYVCTTTGNAASAVWTSTANASTSVFAGGTSTGAANVQVVASTTPAGFTKTSGQIVTFTAGFTNTGSATLNVDATGVSTIQKNTGGGNVNLTGGEIPSGAFITVIWTGSVYLLQPGLLAALAFLNIGQWLKNDGSGNLTIKVPASGALLGDDGSGNFTILNTAVTAGSYTRPKMTVSASGQVTAAASGAFSTRTLIASGTGNYTVPAGCKRLRVRMVGGGGSGSNVIGGNGNVGTQTTFNGVAAAPGFGGNAGTISGTSVPGFGGAGGTGGSGTAQFRNPGGNGLQGGAITTSTSVSSSFAGGMGGASAFGSWPSYGAGGQGSSSGNLLGNSASGGGGGAGEYVELLINNPSGTIAYSVGTGGSAAANAVAGEPGIIIVDEDYD